MYLEYECPWAGWRSKPEVAKETAIAMAMSGMVGTNYMHTGLVHLTDIPGIPDRV